MRSKYFPVLAALSAIVVSVFPARADSYHTYVYISGVPTDVTAYASQTGGHVFLNGNWIGTINSSGHIIGSEEEIVGYVALEPDTIASAS